MTEPRKHSSSIGLTIAIVLAAFSACDDGGDATADAIATSQKACSINLDCEFEGQECATSGPREGTCSPTLCAAASDCLGTEECVSSAGEDLGWCLPALEAGDPCTSAEDRTFRCAGSDESPQALTCQGGTWSTMYTCPDQQECLGGSMGRTVLSCGTEDWFINYAVEGWPCAAEQSASCTFDQGAILDCQAGVWTASQTCSSEGRKCERVSNGDMNVVCENNAPQCLVCF